MGRKSISASKGETPKFCYFQKRLLGNNAIFYQHISMLFNQFLIDVSANLFLIFSRKFDLLI